MIPYVAPLKEMRDLWFEDTLSEGDHRNFNVIYESLLLEGKARNLTNLTMGMVLAGNPHAWLQVMHERLKHLLLSSETFQKKEKAEQIVQAKAKQISRGEGVEKYSKGIRYMRINEKGKGLGKNGSKTRITPLHTSRRNQQVCHMSGKNQGKAKFSPGQGIVRVFWKMSGIFCHLTHVREFCHDILFRLRLHHMVRDLPGLW